MPGRLENKVILITGAERNLGAVFARRMAAEGDHVFIADILCEELEETAAEIAAANGNAVALPMDVTQEVSWIAAIGQVEAQAGRLDALVNNAGIFASNKIQDQPLRGKAPQRARSICPSPPGNFLT